LKVVHIVARDEPFLQDTSNYFTDHVQINGMSVSDNIEAGSYLPVTVTSDFSDPDGNSNDAAVDAVIANAPHVVIGSTVSEFFERIIPRIESRWDLAHPARDRPFYISGALGYGDSAMAPMINADTSMSDGHRPLYRRILGLNWPGALDPTIYNKYQDRYLQVYGSKEHGWENFYDATYYTLYALAASAAPLNGEKIAAGMLRVTDSGTGITQLEVGPVSGMFSAVNQLASDAGWKVELLGAMGPPNWDVYGARHDPGSIWCVNSIGIYQPDKLRYDTTDSSLQPNGTPIADACFPFPEE
jgi:hypothetical protein